MILISYRREDTGAICGRIYDRLQARFGPNEVFIDIDNIPLGVDFRSHIKDSLSKCEILIAVIGPDWTGPGASNTRRIDDPHDFVRMEVATALVHGTRVVPLLIDDTVMPSDAALPDDLKSLTFRNALRVDSGIDFNHHMERLCTALEGARKKTIPPTPPTTPKEAVLPRNEQKPTKSPEPPGSFRRFGRRLLFLLPLGAGMLTTACILGYGTIAAIFGNGSLVLFGVIICDLIVTIVRHRRSVRGKGDGDRAV
jgi:hypothetical protein